MAALIKILEIVGLRNPTRPQYVRLSQFDCSTLDGVTVTRLMARKIKPKGWV